MSKRWIRTSGLVWEELGQEALVVSPAAQKSWLLNPAAAYLWKHCNGAASVKTLARALARKGAEEARLIERELSAFCTKLEAAGLLQTASTPALAGQVSGFMGDYSAPSISGRSLGHGPRKRPSPRGNSGPG